MATPLIELKDLAKDFAGIQVLKGISLSFERGEVHGLLGENTKSIDDVAIRYPDGAVKGKPDRVRLRFETAYMQLASEGKL